jgi:hypothetical protein
VGSSTSGLQNQNFRRLWQEFEFLVSDGHSGTQEDLYSEYSFRTTGVLGENEHSNK